MSDLPDYFTQVRALLVLAGALEHGADALKPTAPDDGDVWLSTDTERFYICYVDGVWTDVTLAYLLLAGGTMSGAIAMGGYKVTGLGAPTADNDAARKTYVDTLHALQLLLTGGTMSGAIAMGTNKITGMGDPTAAQDAATRAYTLAQIAAYIATHAALVATHGVPGTIASVANIATHAALTATHGVTGAIADVSDAIKMALVLGG